MGAAGGGGRVGKGGMRLKGMVDGGGGWGSEGRVIEGGEGEGVSSGVELAGGGVGRQGVAKRRFGKAPMIGGGMRDSVRARGPVGWGEVTCDRMIFNDKRCF